MRRRDGDQGSEGRADQVDVQALDVDRSHACHSRPGMRRGETFRMPGLAGTCRRCGCARSPWSTTTRDPLSEILDRSFHPRSHGGRGRHQRPPTGRVPGRGRHRRGAVRRRAGRPGRVPPGARRRGIPGGRVVGAGRPAQCPDPAAPLARRPDPRWFRPLFSRVAWLGYGTAFLFSVACLILNPALLPSADDAFVSGEPGPSVLAVIPSPAA